MLVCWEVEKCALRLDRTRSMRSSPLLKGVRSSCVKVVGPVRLVRTLLMLQLLWHPQQRLRQVEKLLVTPRRRTHRWTSLLLVRRFSDLQAPSRPERLL